MKFNKINSVQNIKIKSVLKLYKPSERIKKSLMIIEGFREITRSLDAKCELKEIFFCSYYANDKIIDFIKNSDSSIYECSKKVFDKISYRQNPEGILAITNIIRRKINDLEIQSKSIFLVIENIEKPGNLGNIIRTSDATGVNGIILLNNKTDINNPNVIRSSIGSFFSIPIINTDINTFFNWTKNNNIKTFATSPQASTRYTDINFNQSLAIIFGSENKGLSNKVIDLSNNTISIPMLGQNDSLNVSSSASIILYEALRQKSL